MSGVDRPSAFELGAEALDDGVEPKSDPQALEIQAADLAGGLQQRRRVVHPAPLEQDRLPQAAQIGARFGCSETAAAPGRRDATSSADHPGRCAIDRHPRRLGGPRRTPPPLAGVAEAGGEAADHEGDGHLVVEVDFQAPQVRFHRPAPGAVRIVKHVADTSPTWGTIRARP
jgi:hypothetical protein